MGRVGWVSAADVSAVAADADVARASVQSPAVTWYRLSVFDDGWVELPGFGRSVSDTRANLRRALVLLAVLLGGLLAVSLLQRLWTDVLGWSPGVGAGIGAVGLLAVLGYVGWRLVTMRWRDAVQRGGDAAELRELRRAGRLPGLAPGAPRWKRASSAAELAGWMTNVRLTRGQDVVDVAVTTADGDHVVAIRLADGTMRTYRSSDDTLPELLGRFRPGGSPT